MTTPSTTIGQRLYSYIEAPLTNTIRAVPTSLIAGSVLLAFLTFNTALLVLVIFYGELGLFKALIGKSLAGLFPTIIDQGMFLYTPLYLATATLSYFNASLVSFSDVMDRLGGEYSSKLITSIFTSILVISALLSYYVANNMISITSGLFTILISIVAGSFFLMLNETIFGKNAVNFLGLPMLSRMTGSTRPIYACGITG